MTLTINLPPITKKNHQQIVRNRRTGTPCVIPSSQYKQYEESALWMLPKVDKPIDCRVNVQCTYFMPTKRRVDLVNLLEATLDILVKGGILADDNSNIVVGHDGSQVLYDKEHPRTEITITKIGEM